MSDGRHSYAKSDFWPRLVGVILLFVFVIIFRSEFLLVLRLLIVFVQYLFNRPTNPPSHDTPKALIVLGINLILFLGSYFIILKWISLFVLPAHNSHEKQLVYERLIEYIARLHGPAVFVKNGALITRKEEEGKNDSIKGSYASLALVDLASAIVIESRSLPAILNLPKESNPIDERHSPLRVLGPGIGFLRSGERIRASVDLRKQYRTMKGVRGFTSDGIELDTNVYVLFTLGQPVDVMTVIDTKGNGLRLLMVDRDTKRIMEIIEGIEEEDAREIYANIQGHKRERNCAPAFENPSSNRPPFIFDENHIISAVISNLATPRMGNWKNGLISRPRWRLQSSWMNYPAYHMISYTRWIVLNRIVSYMTGSNLTSDEKSLILGFYRTNSCSEKTAESRWLAVFSMLVNILYGISWNCLIPNRSGIGG